MKKVAHLPPYLVDLIDRFKEINNEYMEIDTDEPLTTSEEDMHRSEDLNEVLKTLAMQIALGMASAMDDENELQEMSDLASESQGKIK